MNRQKSLIVSSAALLIVAAIGTVATLNGMSSDHPATRQPSQSAQAAAPARTEISYVAEPGISSLEQLKKVAHDLVIKQSAYGDYVDTMEGHRGGDGGAYWSFYVDGTMSNIGAGSYIQKGGEKIVWKFQKL